MNKIFRYEQTPVGELIIGESAGFINYILFSLEMDKKDRGLAGCESEETALIKETKKQLDEYFSGNRKDFDIPLKPFGTDFQRKVWEALKDIPYGETRSYQQIAIQIGSPKACRAVGQANNRNPISIVIPCHRVIGAKGNLTGYGGGLDIKELLLSLERK